MKIFIKKLGYGSALIASAYFYGQNVTNQYDGKVGVNTETPKATLDVSVLTSNLSKTTNEGIIAPKLSKNRIAKIATPVEGTLVYATDDSNDRISSYTGHDSKVAKITEKGYYYFDGTEWVRAGGVIANSSAVDTSIYTDDGTLNKNRVVKLNSHTLNFQGNKSVTVEPNFGLNIAGQLKVAETNTGTNTDKILVVGTDGIVKTIDKNLNSFNVNNGGNNTDTSIYANNGNLSEDRTVGVGAHSLSFVTTTGGKIGIGTSKPESTLHVAGQVRITDTNGGSENDKILVIDSNNVVKAVTKKVKDIDTNTNIYTNDGTLTGDRIVHVNGHSLGFVTNDDGKIGIGTAHPGERLHVAGKIKVTETPDGGNDDKILVIGSDNVIKKISKTTKDFVDTDTNIYNKNGEITDNRTVTLKNNGSLSVTGTHNNKTTSLKVLPNSETVELDAKVKVKTPETGGNKDKILVVGNDGIVKTIDKTAGDFTADTNTNIYTNDGEITGNKARTVTLKDKSSLVIKGTHPGDNKNIGISVIPTSEMVSLEGRIKVSTPENGGNNDKILVVGGDGIIKTIDKKATDFTSNAVDTSIYANDGHLAADRTVTMDKHSLTFKGTKNIKLEENGTITAESYRSTTFNSFPDYVFQKYYSGHSSLKADYTFNTLSQVEDYIKTNGHLPGYQSAMEIKNQGFVDIAKTQLSNVEKIEELYLHTIEQDKELKNKDKKIKELEYRLEKLESLLSKFNK